jgi:hypothetical protein
MDTRGLGQGMLVDGVLRGSMEVLTVWTMEAEKVLVF